MFTAKFIDNLYFNGANIRAKGKSGKLCKVFAKQGQLDGACVIYSLMMMLILEHKLDWEDLREKARNSKDDFAKSIQRQFLNYGLKGGTRRGHRMCDVSKKLNLCMRENLSEYYTCDKRTWHTVSRHELYEKIKTQLDLGKPVMIGSHGENGPGHAVVAVGYSREGLKTMRLFCLDPSGFIPYMQLWNNVIDVDYLAEDEMLTDYDYHFEDKIIVDRILIIKDPPQPALPFDPDSNAIPF